MYYFFAELSNNLSQYKIDDGPWIACSDEKFLSLTFYRSVRLSFGVEETLNANDAVLTDSGFAVLHSGMIRARDAINEYFIPVLSTESSHAVSAYFTCRVTQIPEVPLPFITRKMDFTKQVFIGHRGHGSNRSGSRIKENTMLSFNHTLAKSRGSNLTGIELDVMLTRDRKLVVFHDLEYPVQLGTVTRLLPVASLDYHQMLRRPLTRHRSFPVKEDKLEFLLENPPLLDKVIHDLYPADSGIVIEIKYPTNDTIRKISGLAQTTRYELISAVLECLKKNRNALQHRWIVLSSFDPDIVAVLRACVLESNILILHNTWFGHDDDQVEDDTVDFKDVRNRLPAVSIRQARKFGAGIALEAGYALGPDFTDQFASVDDVPLFSYGSDNMSLENIKRQKKISGFFIDNPYVIKSTS